jgi:hypothetical protein
MDEDTDIEVYEGYELPDYTGSDWIAERAYYLMALARNVKQVTEPRAQELVFRMMNKLVDSVIMPKEAKPVVGVFRSDNE